MDLSIVIVSYNTKNTLKNCLESIFRFAQDLVFEVIVVDNHSNDGSPEMIKSCFPQVVILLNRSNLGFAKAVNQGIKSSSGEYLLALNSDTLIIDNSIQILWDFLRAHKGVGVVGPKLLTPDYSIIYSCIRFHHFFNVLCPRLPVLKRFIPKIFIPNIKEKRFYSSIREVDFMEGACLMFPKIILKALKGLDERFFLYCEEEDFCYRAKKLGWKIIYYPEAEVIHSGRASTLPFPDSALQQLFYSHFLFFEKHFGKLYAITFRSTMMCLMVFNVFLYKLLALAYAQRSTSYKILGHQSRLIFKAYQPGIKRFFELRTKA
jgi:GT2 family glycosyltransferase